MGAGMENTITHNPMQSAHDALRCGAKTRRQLPCQAPAMRNGRCRMHGGKSPGAPCGERHGKYKHGRFTKAYKLDLAVFRLLARQARELSENVKI